MDMLKSSDGYRGAQERHGVGERNIDGQRILEFGDAMEMIICGTQFKKDESKLVTYRAGRGGGGLNTTTDYLMIYKVHRKLLQNTR